jgi:hypothetical protein
MRIDIIYTFTMLIVLPILVIQTRMLLYKTLAHRNYDGRALFDVLLEELPHDLAIIGMTLAFASYALVTKAGSEETSVKSVFLLLPFLPFAFMSMIPIVSSKNFRLAIGLIAYLTGVLTFLIGLYGEKVGFLL